MLFFVFFKDKDEKDDMTDYEKKRMSIEECKKSLPVYPFRQALLDVSSFKFYAFFNKKYRRLFIFIN